MNDRKNRSITEDDLHAYVDGALPPERRAEVEEWLAANADAAADVAKWKAMNAEIRSAFGDIAGGREAADRAIVARSRPGRGGAYSGWKIAAGFALFFLAGGGAGSLATAALTGQAEITVAESLPAASNANYLIYASEVRHPVEVGADQEEHLVNWLGARLGRQLSAPDLSANGFELVGGRLVPFDGKPGAMLMYEDVSGDRLTVLIGINPEHEGTDFRFSSREGVSTFHWTDGSFGYAISGAVSRKKLLDLAQAVYLQN